MRDLVLGSSKPTLDVPRSRLLYIPKATRERHLYILGKTGIGKSTLISNLIHQDIKKNYAVILFDAGDLATSLVETLPQEIHDTRLMFFSVESPIPYNPLVRVKDIERTVNEIYALLDQTTIEASATGVLTNRMKRLLSIALRDHMEDQTPTLLSLANYLQDNRLPLKGAMALGEKEFNATYDGVVDRLAPFTRDRRIRRIISTHELDFDEIIDQRLVLIVSFSTLEKPLVRFLGTLLFQALQSTIMDRSEDLRKDVAVYIDEFQDYIASPQSVQNFQRLFNQGRRHKLSLTIAHQDFGSVDQKMTATIHSNVGSLVTFGCGVAEAAAMSKHVLAEPKELMFLPDYEFYCKLQQNYEMKTAPMVFKGEGYPGKKKLRLFNHQFRYQGQDPHDPFNPQTAFQESAKLKGNEPKRVNRARSITAAQATPPKKQSPK